MSDWVYCDPDYTKPMRVRTFDDGLSCNTCENVWYICGNWRDKIKLVNIDTKTIITSISGWKVTGIINNNKEED